MIYNIVKRIFDLFLLLITTIILFPVLIIISIAIKVDSKGPILFKQKRVGKNKKHFTIYKFRTMKILAPSDIPTHKLENPDNWITRFGKFLRMTSLDELPQLINILFGQMSFVGPRPALWNQDDLIFEREKYNANAAIPGITGLAQINGRDTLTIFEKAKLDGQYMKKRSIFFDIKLIFLTFIVVIKRKNITEGKTTKKEQEND